MKRSVFLIVSLLIFSSNVYASNKDTVLFNKCIDGDTASFLLNDEEIKVRFLAIDTPETVHPTKKVESYGKVASEYTCTKISSAKEIVLEYDEGSDKIDKYKRYLAWIWVDGSLLQKELISLGYAKVAYIYGTYFYTDELYQEQNIAKENQLGIWQDDILIKFTVTFDEGHETKEAQVNENEKIESYIPKKDGYSFSSWQLNNKDFDFNTPITEDITLVASYKKNITYSDLIIYILLGLLLFFTNKKAFKKKLKKLF